MSEGDGRRADEKVDRGRTDSSLGKTDGKSKIKNHEDLRVFLWTFLKMESCEYIDFIKKEYKYRTYGFITLCKLISLSPTHPKILVQRSFLAGH